MSEIAKTYEPAAVEAKWYDFWLKEGCFTADPARVSDKRPAYSIVIPPPNITGVLHIGHVLNNTIQDILARRARMLGKEVLWLPGTDHAGISAQNVVEKTLRKEGVMKHRDDLGREALVAKIWEWREKYGGIILQQLRALGCSLDWSRTRFTMDEHYSQCVSRVFVDLYKKGLIYRGKRMVNWCPASMTALSDEEVIMKEQNGVLYYFKVEVLDVVGQAPRLPAEAGGAPALQFLPTGRFLTIATTRPETIPGDTAIAVNPKDPRYAGLIGKHARRPLPRENQAPLPIIGDDHVAFDFGTGVLKVTPAHDKADYEIGQRHNLPQIDIMHPNGVMNDLAGADLAGLERFAARKRAVEVLTELGALEKEEPYKNNVGYSERADVPIEPRLSEQWFLKYPSVPAAHEVVTSGKMKFFPERWAKVYDHWMTGIQDWCISRQLWWGHRIPVWVFRSKVIDDPDLPEAFLPDFHSIGKPGGKIVSLSGSPGTATYLRHEELFFHEGFGGLVTYAATLDKEEQQILEKFGFTQDPDVLDTWFSSWLWPFATMGWPEKTQELAKFYPTTDLVTGPDIIFFWVARMIMAGFEYMGEMPFRNVYFTSIIRDKQGRKLSKSLGNSPDPLELIAKYGADAVRFGTMRSAPLGADVYYDEKNVELGRNFCTKLWNATRFRQMQGGESEGEINPALLTSDDKWILLRLDAAIREVSLALGEYRFSDAAQVLYRFFWSEYCDWYLEASKASLGSAGGPPVVSGGSPETPNENTRRPENPPSATTDASGKPPDATGRQPALPGESVRRANTLAVMDFVLAHTLRLMHPFLPFITEELWHGLGFRNDLPANQGGRTIMFAHWPTPLGDDFKAHYILDETDEQFAAAKYEVVNHGRALRRDFNIASNKRVRFVFKPNAPLPAHETEVLRILLNAEPLDVLDRFDAPKGTPTAHTPLGELLLPLEGLIDVAAERERLQKEIVKVEDELAKVRAKLANPNFTEKVPAAVLEEHRQREAAWSEKLDQFQRMQNALTGT